MQRNQDRSYRMRLTRSSNRPGRARVRIGEHERVVDRGEHVDMGTHSSNAIPFYFVEFSWRKMITTDNDRMTHTHPKLLRAAHSSRLVQHTQ